MPVVPTLTRSTSFPMLRAINEAVDQPSMSSVVGAEAARSLWADATATSAALATGAALTALNLGTGANPTISMGGATSQFLTHGGSVVSSQATVATTNAVVTTAVTLALADDTVYMLQAWVVARRTNAAGRAIYLRNVLVFREGGGGATFQGGIDTQLTRSGGAGTGAWNATFSVSGNNVLITVVGNAGHDVNWAVAYTLRSRT